MKIFTKSAMLFIFILLIFHGSLQADMLYGFQYVGYAWSRLAAINIQNGHITDTTYFPAVDAYLQSADYDHTSNTLYSWDKYTDRLCSVNIHTGMLTWIGNSGGKPDWAAGISCLAISPVSGNMFALDWTGYLFQVEKTTGSRTLIGKVPSLFHVHGLAFSPEGVLYCSDTTTGTSQLFTLDTVTAQAVLVTNTSRQYVVTLDFDSSGILYGADNGTNQLGIINITNGSWTAIGPSEYTQGMAFGPVPEPATLLLLALGGMILRRKK